MCLATHNSSKKRKKRKANGGKPVERRVMRSNKRDA